MRVGNSFSSNNCSTNMSSTNEEFLPELSEKTQTTTEGLPLISPEHLKYPWDRLEVEDDETFRLFRIYLEYGPAREGSYERLSRRTGVPEHRLRKISDENGWYVRGEAYQDYIKTILDSYSDEQRRAREFSITDDIESLLQHSIGLLRSQIVDEKEAATSEDLLKRIKLLTQSRKDLKSGRKQEQQKRAAPRNIMMVGTMNVSGGQPVEEIDIQDVEIEEEES